MKQTPRHREQTCGCQGSGGWGAGLGVWGWQTQTITDRMDQQQGRTAQQRDLRSVSCDKPQWERV